MPVIEIRDLTKKFDKITALNTVTLNFNKEINVVPGSNGAGKSTLLKCISRIRSSNNHLVHDNCYFTISCNSSNRVCCYDISSR